MERVTSKDGTEIAFDRHGEGSPIVLVGGTFQHRAIDPRTTQLAALLGEQFTVYHYDRRGRGDSEDTESYSPKREIEDLEALIAEAGGSAFVFGNSSGAVLALDAAASGLSVERLALYEAPFIVDDSRPPVPEDYRERLVELISAGRRGEAVELFLTGPAEVPVEFVAQMRQAPIWSAFESVAHTLAYDAAFMEGTQPRSSRFRRSSSTVGRARSTCTMGPGPSLRLCPTRAGAPWRARPTRWPPRRSPPS